MGRRATMTTGHPWDRWLKRRRLQLQYGRDYHCLPHSMGVQVRNAAYKRGIHVSVEINALGTITVTRRD